MKHLSDLTANLPDIIHATGDADITAPVEEDNRLIQPGGVFVARRGLSADGHEFIPDAIRRGAAAIVGERDLRDLPVPYVRVGNAHEATGWLAAAYHDYPSRQLVVIGVTGTDGKTTTSTLIHSILKAATGGKAGLISTVSADLGGATVDTGLHVTTPSAPQIQALLAQMVANGLTHCVLEMTSHGLAQGRLNGVDLDMAVLTNLTHEHLDYHGTFEAYRAAKGRMFEMLGKSYRRESASEIRGKQFILSKSMWYVRRICSLLPYTRARRAGDEGVHITLPPTSDTSLKENVRKQAIINLDDPNADYFLSLIGDKVTKLGFSISPTFPNRFGAVLDCVWLVACEPQPSGMRIRFEYTPDKVEVELEVETSLWGMFNVQNVLGAVTVGLNLQCSYSAIRTGIVNVRSIPGRMERISVGQDYTAIVDFAHTPNALENALKAGRGMLQPGKKLIAVFGSAGLRDRDKRRLMAEVSERLADFTILTAEDPRSESLDDILETMAQGCISQGGVEGQTFIRVPDRGEALYQACQMAQTGDIVMACGKGHEQSMCFGSIEYPWDDREALRAAIKGAPPRTLPTAAGSTES